MAQELAKGSWDTKQQVGCIIVSEDLKRVYSWGVNGNASGLINKRNSKKKGCSGFLHAELNAALVCPNYFPKIVIVTHKPCEHCCKVLINLGGVKAIYYNKEYASKGEELLKFVDIPLYKI